MCVLIFYFVLERKGKGSIFSFLLFGQSWNYIIPLHNVYLYILSYIGHQYKANESKTKKAKAWEKNDTVLVFWNHRKSKVAYYQKEKDKSHKRKNDYTKHAPCLIIHYALHCSIFIHTKSKIISLVVTIHTKFILERLLIIFSIIIFLNHLGLDSCPSPKFACVIGGVVMKSSLLKRHRNIGYQSPVFIILLRGSWLSAWKTILTKWSFN